MPKNEFVREELDARVLGFEAACITRYDRTPIRPITNGRQTKPVGRYYSLKNGGSAPWESRNELRALYHAEISTDVLTYRVQPHTLKFVIDGVARSYTPDREEKLVGGQERVIEVKDAFEAENDPDYSEKLEHAHAVYRLSGKLFRIQERAEIEARPLFDAVELIQGFRRTAVTVQDILLVQDKFSGHDVLPLGEVRDLFKSAPLGFAKLSAMMVRRILTLDLSHRLCSETSVRLVDHG